jgi:hypothetical protein
MMIMRNTDYYRTILLGIVLGMSSLTLVYMLSVAVDTKDPKEQPITPKSNFEVVNTYQGCDVVRYAPHQAAEYKYFLHCPK